MWKRLILVGLCILILSFFFIGQFKLSTSVITLNRVTYYPILKRVPKSVWDEIINVTEEEERCGRYGFGYLNRTSRRRVFMGALIADDPWDTLMAIAAEAYGIYHTVAFIESNTTQSYFPRELRFYPGSSDLARLQRGDLFGPDAQVTVDYYFDSLDPDQNPEDPLVREHMQREMIAPRWKQNGMQPDDIGVVMDTDETFTRDFLRALQICDVPEFRPGQDCLAPKILGASIVFEGSPECIVKHKLLWRPDMVLGECIDLVGNDTLHKPGLREFHGIHGMRSYGYGREEWNDDGSEIITQKYEKMPNTTMYPLLSTGDFRNYEGGRQIFMKGGNYDWASVSKNCSDQPKGATGYHFHNFFYDSYTIWRKYRTFGHPEEDAWNKEMPSAKLNIPDLMHAVDCIMGRPNGNQMSCLFDQMVGPKPIFSSDKCRRHRRENSIRLIEEDEKGSLTKEV